MFAKALVILVFTSACCGDADVQDSLRSRNFPVDFALFKLRLHMLMTQFEPIPVRPFTIVSDDDDDVQYYFTLNKTELTNVKTIKRADNVIQEGSVVKIPVNFEPLEVVGNYFLSDEITDKIVSGHVAAKVFKFEATLVVQFKNWHSFSLRDIKEVLITHRGKVDVEVKPTTSIIKLIKPDIERKVRNTVAKTVVKSLTEYFNHN